MCQAVKVGGGGNEREAVNLGIKYTRNVPEPHVTKTPYKCDVASRANDADNRRSVPPDFPSSVIRRP